MNNNMDLKSIVTAGLASGHALEEIIKGFGFRFDVTCHSKDGELLWHENFPNLVTTVGKNFLLDTVFSGSGFTATWFFGLVDNASFSAYAAGDTMASHAGWLEEADYNEATRPAVTFSAAASGVKSTSAGSVFTMNASGTVRGCFVTSNSTKSGTTGTLMSAGDFSAAQPYIATNVITVTGSYTLT